MTHKSPKPILELRSDHWCNRRERAVLIWALILCIRITMTIRAYPHFLLSRHAKAARRSRGAYVLPCHSPLRTAYSPIRRKLKIAITWHYETQKAAKPMLAL